MTETTNFMHLVRACRTDKERAELALLLGHAALGFAAMIETSPNREVPVRMMLACREAAHELVMQSMRRSEHE